MNFLLTFTLAMLYNKKDIFTVILSYDSKGKTTVD